VTGRIRDFYIDYTIRDNVTAKLKEFDEQRNKKKKFDAIWHKEVL
jgi:hypothetical protein